MQVTCSNRLEGTLTVSINSSTWKEKKRNQKKKKRWWDSGFQLAWWCRWGWAFGADAGHCTAVWFWVLRVGFHPAFAANERKCVAIRVGAAVFAARRHIFRAGAGLLVLVEKINAFHPVCRRAIVGWRRGRRGGRNPEEGADSVERRRDVVRENLP